MKSIFILLHLLFNFSMGCKADDIHYVMRVHLASGSVNEYVVSDNPVVTADKDYVRIESKSVSTSYALSDVVRYDFREVGTTGVEAVKEDIKPKLTFRYTDNANVTIQGVEADTKVRVYSIDGKNVNTDVQQSNGTANISLVALPANVYIICINNQSIKVTKR